MVHFHGQTRFDAPTIPDDLATKGYVDLTRTLRSVQLTDTTINNQTSFENSQMSIAVEASTRYCFVYYCFFNTSAVADIKIRPSVPSGATGLKNVEAWNGGSGKNTNAIATGKNFNSDNFADNTGEVHGHLLTDVAGNVVVQFTQNAIDPTDTTMLPGSCLMMWKA